MRKSYVESIKKQKTSILHKNEKGIRGTCYRIFLKDYLIPAAPA